LFNNEGKPLVSEGFNDGDISIDTTNNLIYCDTKNGITAYNLSDGKIKFILSEIYGINYIRSFISRHNNQFMVLSNEIEPHPHSDYKPENSYIETQILSAIETDYLGILKSVSREKIYELPSDKVIIAKNDDNIVASYSGKIEVLNKELKPKIIYENHFIPFSMSLNEQYIYMIMKVNDRNPELRVYNYSGQEVFKSEVPLIENYFPPVLGFNNNIYIILKNKIQVYSPDKGFLWEKSTGNITGWIMLADNYLLVSEDKYLFAFDEKGERRFVFMFEHELPVTNPFLNSDGEIFVATQSNLYCLRVKK